MMSKIPVKQILKQQIFNKRFGMWFGLGVALFAMALWVIDIKQEYRSAYIQLQNLKHQEENLKIEWTQLLLESGTWSAPQHINDFATQNLGMGLPDTKHSKVLNLPASLETSVDSGVDSLIQS